MTDPERTSLADIGRRLDRKALEVLAQIARPACADQAAVTLGNADGEIEGLTISDPLTQAAVQARRDKCEELAVDGRALAGLVNALRWAGSKTTVGRGGGGEGWDLAQSSVRERPDPRLLSPLRSFELHIQPRVFGI